MICIFHLEISDSCYTTPVMRLITTRNETQYMRIELCFMSSTDVQITLEVIWLFLILIKFELLKLEILCLTTIPIWRPPSLSQLTPVKFDSGLTHLRLGSHHIKFRIQF